MAFSSLHHSGVRELSSRHLGNSLLIDHEDGFDWLFGVRSSVKIVAVETGNLQSTFTMDLISAMERAIDESDCPIKGIILTNPHNPLGQCYPEALLEECMRFCHKHGIHFITDEVYALSTFQTTDLTESVPFTSALSINVERLGCDRSKVHTVWSMSKDFGVSGFRLVRNTCLYLFQRLQSYYNLGCLYHAAKPSTHSGARSRLQLSDLISERNLRIVFTFISRTSGITGSKLVQTLRSIYHSHVVSQATQH